MKIFIIILMFTIATAEEATKEGSNVFKINEICYEREVLSDSLSTYPMAVDYSTNTLYFSHGKDADTPKAAKLNLSTKEFEHIEGVGTGFAQAVDPKTHNVYFSGDKGTYKYNPNTKEVESLDLNDTNIWCLFFKDILYYAEFPSQYVYTFVDGKSTRFVDMEDTKADTFIIDNEDDMFYTNETGLYSQKKGTKDVILYKEFDGVVAKGLTTDVNGDVYVCLDNGIYGVKKDTKTLVKIYDIAESGGNGIAFDNNNNIIYGDASNLFILKWNKDKTC